MRKQFFLLAILYITSQGIAQNPSWSFIGNHLYNNPTSGYVGIGINPPTERLHVKGTLRIDGDNSGGGSSNSQGGLRLFKAGSGGIMTGIYLANTNNTRAFNFQLNGPENALHLWTYNGSAWNDHFKFTNGGHLGIGLGINPPEAYLHVKAPDFWPGFLVEHNSTTAAYGALVKAKNNLSKSFVVQNIVGTTKELFVVYGDGRTVIGDNASISMPIGYNLYVQNGILTEKVKVALVSSTDWADYVFDLNYKLKPLYEVKEFIKCNKHLPGVPSAQELLNDGGIDLAKMQAKLMEKVEELTLYILELDEKNKLLEKKIQELELIKNN